MIDFIQPHGFSEGFIANYVNYNNSFFKVPYVQGGGYSKNGEELV